MLAAAIVAIFVIAYAAIALEHPIKINKSATALLGAGLLWTVYAVFGGDTRWSKSSSTNWWPPPRRSSSS